MQMTGIAEAAFTHRKPLTTLATAVQDAGVGSKARRAHGFHPVAILSHARGAKNYRVTERGRGRFAAHAVQRDSGYRRSDRSTQTQSTAGRNALQGITDPKNARRPQQRRGVALAELLAISIHAGGRGASARTVSRQRRRGPPVPRGYR